MLTYEHFNSVLACTFEGNLLIMPTYCTSVHSGELSQHVNSILSNKIKATGKLQKISSREHRQVEYFVLTAVTL